MSEKLAERKLNHGRMQKKATFHKVSLLFSICFDFLLRQFLSLRIQELKSGLDSQIAKVENRAKI